MPKIQVYKCKEHGEFEMPGEREASAYCPKCGKPMDYVDEYTE